MKGMDFDRLATLAPINRTAATVAGNRGSAFVPAKTVQDWMDDCPPLRSVKAVQQFSADFIDYTGMTFGRLTVVGLKAKEEGDADQGKWVLRCKCGRFCTRKTRRMKDLTAGLVEDRHLMCGQCQYTAKLRDGFK